MNFKTYLMVGIIVALLGLMFHLSKNNENKVMSKFYEIHKFYLNKECFVFSNKEFCIRISIFLMIIVTVINIFINNIASIIIFLLSLFFIIFSIQKIMIEKTTITIKNKSFNIYDIEDLRYKIIYNNLSDKKPLYVSVYFKINGQFEEFNFKTFTIQMILCFILLTEIIRINEENLTKENLENILASCEIK